MQSHRVVVTVLSKAALEPSIPVSVRGVDVLSASLSSPSDALHHHRPASGGKSCICMSVGDSGRCSREGGGDALIFSSSSNILSCCRRSFAHLANSSWLLVAFKSRRTFM